MNRKILILVAGLMIAAKSNGQQHIIMNSTPAPGVYEATESNSNCRDEDSSFHFVSFGMTCINKKYKVVEWKRDASIPFYPHKTRRHSDRREESQTARCSQSQTARRSQLSLVTKLGISMGLRGMPAMT